MCCTVHHFSPPPSTTPVAEHISSVITDAITVAIVTFAVGVSLSKVFAKRNKYELSSNQVRDACLPSVLTVLTQQALEAHSVKLLFFVMSSVTLDVPNVQICQNCYMK